MSSCLPAIRIHFCISSTSTPSTDRVPVIKFRVMMMMIFLVLLSSLFNPTLNSCFLVFECPILICPTPPPIPPLSLVLRGSLFPIPIFPLLLPLPLPLPVLPVPPRSPPFLPIIPDTLPHLTSLPIFTLGAGVRRRGEAKCQMPNASSYRIFVFVCVCGIVYQFPPQPLLIILLLSVLYSPFSVVFVLC